MTRQAVFITLCLLLAVTTSCFGFVQALLGGCDDIEKDVRLEKATEYESMLIREQAECRKKDKRCKASEEQLQQSQNKLTECEDKLINCGGTQSVQAKKHVEFLKGQIDDLKKHRDRLELELEETQTSFRNLRYTETICQSNYSDLVQQLSEYKNRIQSSQNENQGYQKTDGAGGTLQFYSDYSHILLAGVVIIIVSLLFYINSLLEQAKHAAELREEAEKRHTFYINSLLEKVKHAEEQAKHAAELREEAEKRHTSELKSQRAETLNELRDTKKTKNAKSETKVEDCEVFSADDEDEEDEYEEEQQESDAEDGKIEDNTGSSQSLRARRTPNHPASKPPKGSRKKGK